MLERILEPEIMASAEEAREYDALDHRQVNQAFVDDLLAVVSDFHDVLDVGTGTAQIPVELCRRVESCRVMAADLSFEMLDLARYNIEVNGMIQRIQLDQCDAKEMLYQDDMFDLVIANGFLHHIADPAVVLAEIVRVTRMDGAIFCRDLQRPDDIETLDRLVATYASGANERQQSMFRQSLHAAVTANEMKDIVRTLGFDPDTVQITSDRHWTWAVKRSA